MRCALYRGSIVSHPCGAPTEWTCAQCGRPFCAQHAATGSQDYCAQCAGEYEPPEAPTRVTQDELDAFTPDDFAAFDEAAGATLWRDS